MPLYLCRWPNGDCSIVWARTKEDAIMELDQVGNAEGCPITQLRQFQVHFRLTDDGKLECESLGEGTSERLFTLAYPVLEQTLEKVYGEMDCNQEVFKPEQQARIQAAIEQERKRVRVESEDIVEPETGIGRDIKKQTGMASPLINRIVQQTAQEILKDFKGQGKPH
jgi:hypothetical protein